MSRIYICIYIYIYIYIKQTDFYKTDLYKTKRLFGLSGPNCLNCVKGGTLF